MKIFTSILLAYALLIGPFLRADVSARNGISITTASTLNGKTPNAAINGLPVVSGGGGGSGPTLIDSTYTNGNISGVTSPPINTTGANFIVVAVPMYGGFTTSITFTDSNSNTWTELLNSGSSGTVPRLRLLYCYAPTVGSGHTFSAASFGGSVSILVAAFSGMPAGGPANIYDTEGGSGPTSWTTLAANSITPTIPHTLVVTALAFEDNSASAISIDSGYNTSPSPLVTPWHAVYDGIGGALAWKILTSASAQAPNWATSSSSSRGATIIAAFPY